MVQHGVNGYSEVPDYPDESARGKAIVFLLCLVPMLATVAFGGVDLWAGGILAVLTSLTAVFWTIDAWQFGELRWSTNWLQVPIIALLILGCIQLLPIGGERVPPDLLSVPASNSLSLDPYATRLF